MGKGTTTSGELVARTGFKRELQSVFKSQSEICGGESLGRTRASRRNLNVEATSIESSRGRSVLKGGNKKIRLGVLEKVGSKSSQVKMKRGLVYAERRITTTISHLPEDLVAEILFRVPITSLGSVRSTCKQWNALSKNQIFGKLAEAKNQYLGFMMKAYRICSVRMNVQGIHNGIIDLSIKHVSEINQIEVFRVYHSDGLLLCILFDESGLLTWNPYLGQKRWIPHQFDTWDGFFLGYDNSGKYKIMQYLGFYDYKSHGFKIYDFSSNSWRDLDATPNWKLPMIGPQSVTLKGNAYFCVQEEIIVEGAVKSFPFLLCFDFTSERFGPLLSLPFHCYSASDSVVLSCVRDKQLAVLHQPLTIGGIMEIWVTNKIDYNEVLWTKWLQVNMNLFTDSYPLGLFPGSFFIDEENKVAVVFDTNWNRCWSGISFQAHIIGQDWYFKYIKAQALNPNPYEGFVFPFLSSSSYVPSLVQIE